MLLLYHEKIAIHTLKKFYQQNCFCEKIGRKEKTNLVFPKMIETTHNLIVIAIHVGCPIINMCAVFFSSRPKFPLHLGLRLPPHRYSPVLVHFSPIPDLLLPFTTQTTEDKMIKYFILLICNAFDHLGMPIDILEFRICYY